MLNNSGIIPTPTILYDQKGEILYRKTTRQKFGIFKGLGMSIKVLKTMKQDADFIITFDDGKSPECGKYKTKVHIFFDTGIYYNNGGIDPQLILKFEDFIKISSYDRCNATIQRTLYNI